MDLFETLKTQFRCDYISDLSFLWRDHQQSFAFAVLRLDFKQFELSQWIDLCNYLQVPFTEKDIVSVGRVRALFIKYA